MNWLDCLSATTCFSILKRWFLDITSGSISYQDVREMGPWVYTPRRKSVSFLNFKLQFFSSSPPLKPFCIQAQRTWFHKSANHVSNLDI